MTLTSGSITSRSVVESTTEPARKPDGLIWRDSSGNNVELHQWDGSQWETWFSRGPDTPEYPVDGTRWTDGSDTLRYNAGQWELANAAVSGTTQPTNRVAGLLWRDSSGNNVELHQWDGSQWETWFSRGPDTPEYPVSGTLWMDSSGNTLRYNGASFENVSVTDHGNLSGITSDAHHPRPVFQRESGDVTLAANDASTISVTFENTYKPDAVMGFAGGWHNYESGAGSWAGCSLKSMDTDGNGDVTGLTIVSSVGDSGQNGHWEVMGETV